MNLRGWGIKLIDKRRDSREKKLEKVDSILFDGGRIGDIMTKTPMIRALGESGKNFKIDVLVQRGAQDLLKNNPYINNIIIKEKNIFFNFWRLRNRYSLYIDFSNRVNFLHVLGMRVLNPRYIIGGYRREKYGIKRDGLNLIDAYVEFKPDEHALVSSLKAIEPLGIQTENKRYEIFLGESENSYREYFSKERKNIVFNFTAGSADRGLNEEHIEFFLSEIPKLDEKIQLHIMTMPDRYEEFKERVKKYDGEKVKLLPKTKTILEAGALVKECDLLFSVDTGIVHVASAFNTPIVVISPNEETALKLFAPTSEVSYVVKASSRKEINSFDKVEVLEKIRLWLRGDKR